MSGTVASECSEHEDAATTSEEAALDWSVSGISAASGFDPDRYHSELATTSSSNWTTPEKIRPSRSNVGPDIDRLVGSVGELKSALASISEKTVTPLNSPRTMSRGSQVSQENERTLTPQTQRLAPGVINTTPPVKDPGPGRSQDDDDSKKLDGMRNMLKELENARQKYKSKIPKRSLNFSAQKDPAVKKNGDLDRQFEEMNDFLDRVKSSNNTSSSTKENTVIENKDKSEDSEEVLMRKQAEKTYKVLLQKVQVQEQQLVAAREAVEQKDKVLLELKACWSQVVQALTGEREELIGQHHQAVEEGKRLKREHEAAKQQFARCQNELGRALELANEFKQKVEEEEHNKQDLVDQLLAERASKNLALATDQAQFEKVLKETKELKSQVEMLEGDKSSLKSKWEEAVCAREEYEKRMATERYNFQVEREQLQQKVASLKESMVGNDKQLKATETSLHTFYLSQMESILSEKVDVLQSYVKEWEAKLGQEKEAAVKKAKQEQDAQVQELNEEYSALLTRHNKQVESLEAQAAAARKEADALREQLQLKSLDQQHWNSTSTNQIQRLHNNLHMSRVLPLPTQLSSSDEEGMSRRSLPPDFRKRPEMRKRKDKTTTTATIVMNNMRRPKSATANIPFTITENATTSFGGEDHESSVMTMAEKKEVVKSFIKQFLEDNPEAVLDAHLMTGLNQMANKLMEQSYRLEDPKSLLVSQPSTLATSMSRRGVPAATSEAAKVKRRPNSSPPPQQEKLTSINASQAKRKSTTVKKQTTSWK